MIQVIISLNEGEREDEYGIQTVRHSRIIRINHYFCVALLAVVIFALYLKAYYVQESGLQIVITSVSFISLFVGGFISGGKGKEKGWLLGGATGLIYAQSLFFYFNILAMTKCLLRTGHLSACFILVAMMGGILGVNLTTIKNSNRRPVIKRKRKQANCLFPFLLIIMPIFQRLFQLLLGLHCDHM